MLCWSTGYGAAHFLLFMRIMDALGKVKTINMHYALQREVQKKKNNKKKNYVPPKKLVYSFDTCCLSIENPLSCRSVLRLHFCLPFYSLLYT